MIYVDIMDTNLLYECTLVWEVHSRMGSAVSAVVVHSQCASGGFACCYCSWLVVTAMQVMLVSPLLGIPYICTYIYMFWAARGRIPTVLLMGNLKYNVLELIRVYEYQFIKKKT